MQLHHDMEIARRRATSNRFIFEQTVFTNAMALTALRESLNLRGLLTEGSGRSVDSGGRSWTSTDGVFELAVSQFPVTPGVPVSVEVQCLGSDLDKVIHSLSVNGITFEGVITRDVNLQFTYHDELNPKLWDQFDLRPKVKKGIEKIVNEFLTHLDLTPLYIIDVVITGSNANFQWNNKSDLDVHIIVDRAKLEAKHGSIALKYTEVASDLWNAEHELTILGIDVELYVQADDEEHHSSGVYSIKNNKWVCRPQLDHNFEVSDKKVHARLDRLEREIIRALASSPSAATLNRLWKKIKTIRRSGLKTQGELSPSNLMFKKLRSSGLLDKLSKKRDELNDRELSLFEKSRKKENGND
jgi:hypothetical protein